MDDPSVSEVLNSLRELTVALDAFLRGFKTLKLPALRKQAIHHPKVRCFILVYATKILVIMVNVLHHQRIKSLLALIQLQYSRKEDISGALLDNADSLASSLVSMVMGLKGMLQNALVLLSDSRVNKHFDLDSMIAKLVSANSRPHGIQYYHALVNTGKILNCCWVCGAPAGGRDPFFDSKLVTQNGQSYHADCLRFWNHHEKEQPLLLDL